jgi:hypothetical protein
LYPSSHKKKLFIRIVFFSFLFFFNFSFLFQYYIYWGVRFIFIFNLFFMRLSQSHDPDYGLDELTRLTRVFSSFSNWLFYFSITSFNIGLIENYISWFISVCFLWGYSYLMNWFTSSTS